MKTYYKFLVGAFCILFALSCNKISNDKTDSAAAAKPIVSVTASEVDQTFDLLIDFVSKGKPKGGSTSDRPYVSMIEEVRSIYKKDVAAIDQKAIEEGVSAEEMEKAGSRIASTYIKYTSVGADGNPIVLSGKIYVPCLSKNHLLPVSDVLINLFGTIPQGDNKMTEMAPLMYSFKHLATKGLAVFEPEYIGFGVSSDYLQTYLCHHLIAKNCADMLVVGINLLQEKFGVKFKNGYGTYITGYSQGGGNALALARYLTVEASDQVKDLVNLKKTFCGAGPYDPYETLQTWTKNDGMFLSVILPMVFYGMNEVHSDIFVGDDLKEYFYQEYWDSNIPTLVYERQGGLTECVEYDKAHAKEGGATCMLGPEISPKVIASEQALSDGTEKNTKLSQALKSERICYDWTSTAPITMFCDNKDNIVPPVNTNLAYEALYKKTPELIDSIKSNTGDHILAMLVYNLLVSKEEYK